ncbi:MAG TPA: CHAT domain-containing protein [Oculatellaceae cyanobacterium]|jgi:CHAT domain-containing protein
MQRFIKLFPLISVLVATSAPFSFNFSALGITQGLTQTLTTDQLAVNSPTVELIKRVASQHKATLVQYSIIEESSLDKGKKVNVSSELLIWVINPTGKIALRRVDLKSLLSKKKVSLEELIDNSRNGATIRNRRLKGILTIEPIQEDSENKSLQQLHQLLIEPIVDLLPTEVDAHVIFIPQGSLFLVPFPALQDQGGKYLIDRHTISTAPSIQVLDLTYQRKQRRKQENFDVLIVGNPTMPSIASQIGEPPQQLPSLPGTEEEASAIARLYNTQALTGKAATKSAVVKRLSQANIIHLATHTFNNFQEQDVPGAIVLAPESNDNGLLTASEIMKMELSADLVVLSGAESATGRITADGVIGLSRAFIAAGATSAIGSLWNVSDRATTLLMVEFYRNLQQNPDKANALRMAMLATRKQYPNPKDWAAFTLIGES